MIAQRHAVTGWVRNEPDGSVVLEIQGVDLAVNAALNEIRQAMDRNIRSQETLPIADAGHEIGFEIER